MDKVIEISSSPEPLSRSSRDVQAKGRSSMVPKQRKRARTPLVNGDEIIELTDSEDDIQVKRGASRSKCKISAMGSRREGSQAGPSRPATKPFGTPRKNAVPDAHAQGGQSAASVERLTSPGSDAKPQAIPLFLPEDEDDQPPQFIPRPQVLYPASVVVDPIPEEILEPSLKPDSLPPNIDPMDTYVARVLEIIPDVQPTHVLSLLEQNVEAHQDGVVEVVLHTIFEDPNYPKIDKKGKRKREEAEEEESGSVKSKVKIDYGNKDRVNQGGPLYAEIALEQLLVDFPYIPKPHVRKTFFANNALYAPTHLFLAEEKLTKKPLPYITKTTPSRVTGKGKAKQDLEFDKEKEWILLKLQGDVTLNDSQAAEEMNEQEYEDCGDGIECGCCFATYPFDKMIQCPDCHLFCSTCMTSYASTLLGSHDPAILCMDQSGCKLAFPESELRRFLTPKLFALYQRVKQRKEIEAAGLENLEECPFCEYKVVIENEGEKLFRCESADCGAVSCRQCKKPDHLPKSCKEMEDDKHLDARHAIEEAMTRALMRNCPKCQKAFVKELGCNKMMCPNCQTMSCYICRKIITGYEHFSQPPPYSGVADPNKCSLWDPVEQRHSDEVRKAANEALEEYKQQHPDMDQEELKAVEVELPPAPVAGPAHLQPIRPIRPLARDGIEMAQRLNAARAEAQARMQQIMAAGAGPQLNPAFINFNINFGMPPVPPAFAGPAPRAVPVAAAGRKRRARRR